MVHPQHTQELVDNFSYLDDWEDKYQYIIDLGKTLPPLPDEYRTDSYKVQGCVSQVWLKAEVNDNVLSFVADSDAHIVRGLIAILHSVYNNQPIDIMNSFDIEAYFNELGLGQNLLPNRRNGFFAMVERLKKLSNT